MSAREKKIWRVQVALVGMMMSIAMSLVSCSDDSTSGNEDDWLHDISVSEISTGQITGSELVEKLLGQKMHNLGNVNYAVIRYTSKYKGEEIELSGLVAWPAGVVIKEVVIGNHWTIASNKECPSNALSYDMALAVTQGALVVNADYLGYGLTKDMVHPYLCAGETARHSVDCFRAALKYVESKGVKLTDDFATYNIGYSQGGAVALAVQKYIESDTKLLSKSHLKKTLCGAGPYSPIACYREYMNQEELEFPVVLPMIIMGMKESCEDAMRNVEVADYFAKEIVSGGVLDAVKSKKYTASEINQKIREAVGEASMDKILSAEAMDETSELSRALRRALEENEQTEDWQPKTALQLYHSTDDMIVPFVNYQEAVKHISGEKVQPGITGAYGQHTSAGVAFYTQVIVAGINK